MALIIKAALFLTGLFFGLQMLAAFFRIIDMWYARHREWRCMLKYLLIWNGLAILIFIYLGEPWQRAFLGGVLTYPLFYFTFFAAANFLIVRYKQPR
ncbi:MAG: hypothetical protein WCP20_21790 [Desulfuromonadales bacterium]